ncbi:MAG: EamA family transporter [Burkholderiaceae bacterium]|jgi:drug/metabolite transporter (DMT)-like permease
MPTSALYAICILIWGTTWIAITAQIAVLAPELGVAIRFGLAAGVLLAVCWWRKIPLRFAPRVQALVLAQGLANFYASYVCVYAAERYVASGVVAVGYAASPLIGLILARVLLDVRMSRRVAFGGVAGVCGVALIFWHEFARMTASQQVLWGAELTAAAVLLSGLATIAASAYHRMGVKGWGPLALAMAWGAAGALAQVLLRGVPWNWSWRPEFLGTLAYLALFGSVLAFGAYYALVHRVGPAKAGYTGVLTPVVALGVSSLYEGFLWTGLTVAGIALAILGNVVALWPRATPSATANA